MRIRPAHRDDHGNSPRPEEWCLLERLKGEREPTKDRLSIVPAETRLKMLVNLAKLRWRIERDYQELKQELRLGRYDRMS